MITETGENTNAADPAAMGSPKRINPNNTIMVPPSLLMGQPPRYDEVYYPRTDKRMISKSRIIL